MRIQQYFYFIGTTTFLPVWVYLFRKKDKRKKMLCLGIGFGIATVIIDHLYARLDYWNPVYIFPHFPFEDFYYGVVFGGISAAAYEIILNKRNNFRRACRLRKKLLLVFGLITAFSFWFIVDILHLNSIIAHLIPPIIIGVVCIVIQKELYKIAVINALLMAFIDFIQFQILLLLDPNMFRKYWILHNLSGIFILSVPIEELLFAFAVGFGAANAYEVIYGCNEMVTVSSPSEFNRSIL